MKFIISQKVEQKVWTIEISAIEATAAEVQRELEFGPIVVNAGGSFNGPPAFHNGSKLLSISTNGSFTYSQPFNGNNDPEAQEKAQVFINEMQQRIFAAKAAWNGQINTVQGIEFTA